MDAIGVSAGGGYLQTTAQADYANAQVVAIGSGATTSSAFATATVVSLHANVGCWFRVGGTAAASTAGSDFLPANTTWMLKIPLGAILSFIQATVGGFIAVTPMLNQYPNPAAPGAGITPPLDLVTGAASAWGFRRLATAYAGKAMQVKRASDNATQDIGFVGGDFDSAGFNAFIGASSGSIAIWYDQSGNGLNLTSTAGPTVNLTAANGKPTAVFPAGVDLAHAATPTSSQPFTFSVVAQRTGNFSGYNGLIGDAGSPTGLYFDATPNQVTLFAGSIQGSLPATDNVLHAISAVFNGATSVTTVDGTSTSPGSFNPGGNNYTGVRVGNLNGSLNGDLSEGIVWNSQLSAGNITTLGANQKSYWGTP